MSVPLEIQAGNTVYVHRAERHHDLYVPRELLPNPSPQHTWRYCVAKAQGNTVYFSNQQTAETVWVLPDLHPTNPETTVVMKTIGTTDSATKRIQLGQAPAAAPPSSVAADPPTAASSDAVIATPPSSATIDGSAVASSPVVGAVSSTMDARKSIQEKLQESIRQKLAARGVVVAAASPRATAEAADASPAASASVAGVHHADPHTGQGPHTPVSAFTPTHSAPDDVAAGKSGGGSRVASSSPGGGVRDRIAAWRASKGTPGSGGARSSRSGTPQASSTHGGDDDHDGQTQQGSWSGQKRQQSTPVVDSPARQDQHLVSRLERDAVGRGAGNVDDSEQPHQTFDSVRRPTPTTHPSSRREAAVAAQTNRNAAPPASLHEPELPLEKELYEEKRRQMLQADEALQQQKAALLRTERLAVERAALAAETRAREEENYARIVTERRRLEEERLALERQEKDKLLRLLAQPDAEALQREAAQAVNAYALAEEDAKQRAEAARLRAATFSEAIAQSLVDAVHPDDHHKKHAHDKDRSHSGTKARNPSNRRDAARSPSSSSASSSSGDSLDGGRTSHRHALVDHHGSSKQQKRAPKPLVTIPYTPSLKYIGHIGGGPTPAQLHMSAANSSSSTVSRTRTAAENNRGPLLTAMRAGSGTYLYDAQGTVRFDGKWKRDKKHGQGDMSTATTVYEGGWRDDAIHGKGMLQTKVLKASVETKAGAVHGSAVVQVANGGSYVGRVEHNDVASPGALTLSNGDGVEWKWAPAGAPRGTGECRVQFHSGDSYVGGVQNFMLHGRGAYLSVDGDEYVGEFVRGFMEGRGFFHFRNGNTYEGELHHGLFHGSGVYHSGGDYVYDGMWVDGTMHGQGKVTYANGDVWEGSFERDHRREGRYVASSMFQLPPTPS